MKHQGTFHNNYRKFFPILTFLWISSCGLCFVYSCCQPLAELEINLKTRMKLLPLWSSVSAINDFNLRNLRYLHFFNVRFVLSLETDCIFTPCLLPAKLFLRDTLNSARISTRLVLVTFEAPKIQQLSSHTKAKCFSSVKFYSS